MIGEEKCDLSWVFVDHFWGIPLSHTQNHFVSILVEKCLKGDSNVVNPTLPTSIWLPYTQSSKIQKIRKINWKSIFQYIIGARKKYVPLDMLNMCIFYFGLPGNDCTKDEKTAEEVGRLRGPNSCAVLGS